jgi:hypothetical protein
MVIMLLLTGAFMLGLASGLVSPRADAVRTPGWLVAIGGVVFLLAGIAIVFQHRPAVGWVVAMVMLACAAAAGLWIALLADPADISGGVPLMSDAANARLGRLAFGFGGLVSLALLAWGLWLGPGRQRID